MEAETRAPAPGTDRAACTARLQDCPARPAAHHLSLARVREKFPSRPRAAHHPSRSGSCRASRNAPPPQHLPHRGARAAGAPHDGASAALRGAARTLPAVVAIPSRGDEPEEHHPADAHGSTHEPRRGVARRGLAVVKDAPEPRHDDRRLHARVADCLARRAAVGRRRPARAHRADTPARRAASVRPARGTDLMVGRCACTSKPAPLWHF